MTLKKRTKIQSETAAKAASHQAKPASAELKTMACLLGSEQLVSEYSAVLQEKGIAVIELKNLASLKTSAKKITIAFELTLNDAETKFKNLSALDEALPAEIPIVTSAITETVLAQVHTMKNKERIIGIASFPTLLENSLVELSPSLYTKQEIADKTKDFFTTIKKESVIVEDAVGMVMPRILCQIINEALFTVAHDVANPKDVDEAMKHGAHFPHAPIEWGEKIGFKNIVGVLDALYKNHGEEKYRVAPLLRQMAIAGTFWGKNHIET